METSPTLTPPTRKKFARRLFNWRVMRKVLFVLAALITLGALFIAEEDWRGSHAWASYKRDMEAKGEHFDAARLIPPEVHDNDNFAATPLLAAPFTLPSDDPRQLVRMKVDPRGFFDFEAPDTNINTIPEWVNLVARRANPLPGWMAGDPGDLIQFAKEIQGTNQTSGRPEITQPAQAATIMLDKLKICEPILAELYSASARRYSRFNLPYQDLPKMEASDKILLGIYQMKTLIELLTAHAECEMVSGHGDDALEDFNVMFRFDDGLKDEPLLISQLERLTCVAITMQPIAEGLAGHLWSEPQLQVLQDRLGKTDLLASVVRGLYGDRDFFANRKFDQGYLWLQGWNRLEQLNYNRAFIETVMPRIDLARRMVSPSVNHSMNLVSQTSYPANRLSAFLYHHIMASTTMPHFATRTQGTAFMQNQVNMLMVACALERYRLAQGQYPDALDALSARFAPALPHDIINGQPLKYRRLENGRFILYSVGWNEKDDGGVVAATKGTTPRQDQLQGDWVFQYPENP